MKKGQKKWWRCAHFEYDYDDWGKYCYCHNKDCPHKDCRAENVFQMSVCPFYAKGKESFVLDPSGYEDGMREFKERMEEDAKKKEIEERALLKYLKEKYES